ncbi:MAG: quinolinate synthase NadA [Candidatus Electrothrix sp. AUS3]|nr:quinolinate synthase NadA [Candidatus Electrothrix gigas]
MIRVSEIELEYEKFLEEEVFWEGKVKELKEEFGNQLMILCHYYQRNSVFRLGDAVGDSLELAKRGAANKTAKYLVFCGAHFMAETQDMLASKDQIVMMPDLKAGCTLVNQIKLKQLEEAWGILTQFRKEQDIVPIAYVNSSADIKAFCGKHNGTICTSSSSNKIFQWAINQNKMIVFFPDEHIGRNAANSIEIPRENVFVWKRNVSGGTLTEEQIKRAQLILWSGSCRFHDKFTPELVKKLKKEHPDARVVVHSECCEETVAESDYYGSTSTILNCIADSEPESKWFIGTEYNMVERMRRENEGLRDVNCLAKSICSFMYKADLKKLYNVLVSIKEGTPINIVSVGDDVAISARRALKKMLEITS